MMQQQNIQIDHSRADAERRMRLLEMAKGDLQKARQLEGWVQMGEALFLNRCEGGLPSMDSRRLPPDDGLAIPDFLKAKPRA